MKLKDRIDKAKQEGAIPPDGSSDKGYAGFISGKTKGTVSVNGSFSNTPPKIEISTTLFCEMLRQSIRTMTRHSPIHKVLKEELTALGYWKNKPRGNPKKGYEMGGKKDE